LQSNLSHFQIKCRVSFVFRVSQIGDEDPIQFDDLQEGPAVRIVLDDSHSSAADAQQESLESESEEESEDEEQQAEAS